MGSGGLYVLGVVGGKGGPRKSENTGELRFLVYFLPLFPLSSALHFHCCCCYCFVLLGRRLDADLLGALPARSWCVANDVSPSSSATQMVVTVGFLASVEVPQLFGSAHTTLPVDGCGLVRRFSSLADVFDDR
uniref:(northern house mosquito) hypothetical protein n=1 Tax=Culex pipiens TaxID=7175 RepID=A0A8D8FWY3_CULPI